jgi:hypothetical protein
MVGTSGRVAQGRDRPHGESGARLSYAARMKQWMLAGALLAAACSSRGPGKLDGFQARDGFVEPDGSSFPDGGFEPSGDGGAPAGGSVYCGPADATECLCGVSPAAGLTEGASCGPGDVSAPYLCCATANWPNATPGNFVDVDCVCSQIFCEVDSSGDVCQCGFGAPQQGDTPTSSCTGAVCCRTRSTLAPVCACYKQGFDCGDDETVGSCAPSDLRCSDQQLDACH